MQCYRYPTRGLRQGYIRVMTTPSPRSTEHETALNTIELQLASLSSGAPAAGLGEAGWSGDQIADRLVALRRDRTTLLAHWDRRASIQPTGATICDQLQPCPVALGVVEKYR